MGHFYKVVDMASRRIRYFRPCENGHYNWKQLKWLLSDARWYASNQILPAANDRVILVGGRGLFIYEFVPKLSSSSRDKSFSLSFLQRTYERHARGNNLYPFTFSRMAICSFLPIGIQSFSITNATRWSRPFLEFQGMDQETAQAQAHRYFSL